MSNDSRDKKFAILKHALVAEEDLDDKARA